MALGVELVVLSILVIAVTLRLQAGTLHRLPAKRRRSWRRRLIGLNTSTLSITIAGVGLVTGRLGGFLWLLPTILICLIWSTNNAWGLAIDAAGAQDRGHRRVFPGEEPDARPRSFPDGERVT